MRKNEFRCKNHTYVKQLNKVTKGNERKIN